MGVRKHPGIAVNVALIDHHALQKNETRLRRRFRFKGRYGNDGSNNSLRRNLWSESTNLRAKQKAGPRLARLSSLSPKLSGLS